MLLSEAKEKLDILVGKSFGEIFTDDELKDIVKAKGRSGQLLELALGLNNTNFTLDFEDGELKTNKCDQNSKPLETIFITQIASIIDDLISKKNFYSTHLYKKLRNILYVPISKVGDPKYWKFLQYIHVNLDEPQFETIKLQLENDYYTICEQIVEHIENSPDGFIHTSNGKLIQIRSKDSKPYHPIFSNRYNRYVSNKNHAFYFKKDYIKAIRDIIE